MFTDAMKESKQTEISLNGVSAVGIELLLNFAYTGKLDLNIVNVQDILSAANHVQVNPVVEACANYLHSQLDIDNCVDLINIAETYSLDKLRQQCYRFACNSLYKMDSEINRFTWQQIKYILKCDFPVDCSEGNVFRIVLKWIHTQLADINIVHRLLNYIHFSEIASSEIDLALIESNFMPDSQIYKSTLSLAKSLRRLRCLQQTKQTQFPVSNGGDGGGGTTSNNNNNNTSIAINSTNDTNSHKNSLTNSRGMELALINVGGFRFTGVTNEITYYLPSVKKWHHLTSIPHVDQCNYGTAVFRNELYVVGGCYNVCLKEYIHPFGFRYNPMTNKWTTIAPMQKDRCRFSLNFVGDALYAIGGASEIDEIDGDLWLMNESNSERYDPEIDSWIFIPPIPENRTQHSGASYSNFLYISGGLERQRVLSTFWRYDTIKSKWESLCDLRSPRADHVMLIINKKLYVCGGWYEENHDHRRLEDRIDVYDPDALDADGQWIHVTHIPTPKYHAGIVAIDTKIYIIGGFYSDSMFDRSSSTIECYDVLTDEWTNLDRYPQNSWECTCVSLYIPKFRDDMEVLMDSINVSMASDDA